MTEKSCNFQTVPPYLLSYQCHLYLISCPHVSLSLWPHVPMPSCPNALMSQCLQVPCPKCSPHGPFPQFFSNKKGLHLATLSVQTVADSLQQQASERALVTQMALLLQWAAKSHFAYTSVSVEYSQRVSYILPSTSGAYTWSCGNLYQSMQFME